MNCYFNSDNNIENVIIDLNQDYRARIDTGDIELRPVAEDDVRETMLKIIELCDNRQSENFEIFSAGSSTVMDEVRLNMLKDISRFVGFVLLLLSY